MNELTTIDKKKSKKILGYVVVIALAAAVIVGQHIYWNRQLTKAEEKEETSSSVVVQDDGTITVNSQTLMSAMKGTDKLIAYEITTRMRERMRREKSCSRPILTFRSQRIEQSLHTAAAWASAFTRIRLRLPRTM